MKRVFRLVGEQGSGKTTVARGLAMVLQAADTTGLVAHVCSEGLVSLWRRDVGDFEITDLEHVPVTAVAVFHEYLPGQFDEAAVEVGDTVIALAIKTSGDEQKQPSALDA